mmetsp:Transcript_64737/g.134967  ORF Transcript_64737/g.134967 Transcript_64737/m.134967 type:complete len:477 (-) Transcript_64737:20-1450(-)
MVLHKRKFDSLPDLPSSLDDDPDFENDDSQNDDSNSESDSEFEATIGSEEDSEECVDSDCAVSGDTVSGDDNPIDEDAAGPSLLMHEPPKPVRKKRYVPTGNPRGRPRKSGTNAKKKSAKDCEYEGPIDPFVKPDSEMPDDMEYLEFSITIGLKGKNIDVQFYGPRLQSFLEIRCLRGGFTAEKGGALKYLHFQGVIVLRVANGPQCRKVLRDALGWKDKTSTPPQFHICVKQLENSALHTFEGMIGYIIKDENEPHFMMWEHNVTSEDKALGRKLYALYGKVRSNKVSLNQGNIFDRMEMFYMHNTQQPLQTAFDTVPLLTEMIQSGHYMPSSTFCAAGYGRGFDLQRFNALWQMKIAHETCTDLETRLVFFPDSLQHRSRRYFSTGLHNSEPSDTERTSPVLHRTSPVDTAATANILYRGIGGTQFRNRLQRRLNHLAAQADVGADGASVSGAGPIAIQDSGDEFADQEDMVRF